MITGMKTQPNYRQKENLHEFTPSLRPASEERRTLPLRGGSPRSPLPSTSPPNSKVGGVPDS